MILVSTKDLNNVTIALPVLNNAGLTESKVSALPKSVKNIQKILLQSLHLTIKLYLSRGIIFFILLILFKIKKILC